MISGSMCALVIVRSNIEAVAIPKNSIQSTRVFDPKMILFLKGVRFDFCLMQSGYIK